jgi:hypothetical protein
MAWLRQEQEHARFTDELMGVFFVPAPVLLNGGRRFPDFDPANLAKDPQGQTSFVSHPWLTKEHPDPEGKHVKRAPSA